MTEPQDQPEEQDEPNWFELYLSASPSKRSVKNKSGRSGRKQQNGQSFQQLPNQHHVPHTSVGSTNIVRSIYGSTKSEYGATPTQQAIVFPTTGLNSPGWNSDGTPNRL